MALLELLNENGIEPNGVNIAMAKRIFSHWDLIMELKYYCVSNLDIGTTDAADAADATDGIDGVIFDLFLGCSDPNDCEMTLAEALRQSNAE